MVIEYNYKNHGLGCSIVNCFREHVVDRLDLYSSAMNIFV